MTTVNYTVGKTVRGEYLNIYRSRSFKTHSGASRFAAKLHERPDVTDIRVLS